MCEVDSELIELALRLIVDNAMKYSPPHTPILIGAEHLDMRVVLSVHSDGPGISEADQTRIFSKFYRAESSYHVPGTGMGLAIAREIVQAHRGRIWVESARGQGATFYVSLPLGEGPRD